MAESLLPPVHSPRVVDLAAAAKAIGEFLRALGLDEAKNIELVGTGQRVAEAFAHEFCAGEGMDLHELIRPNLLSAGDTHENSRASRARVLLRDIPLVTMCPHHLLPAEGTADVVYAPDRHLVGIGALASLVDKAGRRLVLQEILGADIVDTLVATLAPQWLVVRIRLAHACMRVRGERAHGTRVETLSTHGDVPDSVLVQLGAGS